MTLLSKYHYDLMEQFEKEFSGRKDKEQKALWSQGNIYQDGQYNQLFLAYRKGVALGRAMEF